MDDIKELIWKDLVQYEGIYKISEKGDIKNNLGKILKTSLRSGYGTYLRIGGYTSLLYPYTCGCKVAFFRMYKKALTASEIKNNFNQIRKRYNI